QYINREDKALFLAYKNNHCIGQIRIIKDWKIDIDWNRYEENLSKSVAKSLIKNQLGNMFDGNTLYGIQVQTADGKMKPLPELIGHVADRFKNLTETQK
ncbi:hypothetical protein PZE06_28235, partial [Robertmurraya sp. DFI.2.37]|nr:hypothetical protein [Robertmurraya sp. DFI.2.37]